VILLTLFAAALAVAQRPSEVPPPPPDKPAEKPADKPAVQAPAALPEEEDEADRPKTFDFNPIEADKDILVGKEYLKKGSLKAALGRFTEATNYNPQSAEAFRLVGETREKLKDRKGAKLAYQKYLDLAPKAKDAGEIRKRIAKLG
jgi:tetratricopeptide (TPR) repeat protein